MHWILTLALAGAPDAGAPAKPGIVEYGAAHAAESWGPGTPEPLKSVLDVSSRQLTVRGPLKLEPIRKVLTKELHRFDHCTDGSEHAFVLDLEVNFRGVVT